MLLTTNIAHASSIVTTKRILLNFLIDVVVELKTPRLRSTWMATRDRTRHRPVRSDSTMSDASAAEAGPILLIAQLVLGLQGSPYIQANPRDHQSVEAC